MLGCGQKTMYVHNIGTGEFWNISFYVKGEIGQELQFVLIDGTNWDIIRTTYKIRYKGWRTLDSS